MELACLALKINGLKFLLCGCLLYHRLALTKIIISTIKSLLSYYNGKVLRSVQRIQFLEPILTQIERS